MPCPRAWGPDLRPGQARSGRLETFLRVAGVLVRGKEGHWLGHGGVTGSRRGQSPQGFRGACWGGMEGPGGRSCFSPSCLEVVE